MIIRTQHALAGLILTLMLTLPAQAALFDRGGGLIYDDGQNITWLQDANYAKTSGYDADGLMTWAAANTWTSTLSFGGVTGWRLPETMLRDPSCVSHGSYVTAENCTGSELGNLFYKSLGNFGASNAPGSFGLVNSSPFINMYAEHGYKSSTELDASGAYYFHFASGYQAYSGKENLHYAIAVHEGDVASVPTPVPEPETYVMLLAGLGLLYLTAKRQRQELNA